MLIFEKSQAGRTAKTLFPQAAVDLSDLPADLLRQTKPCLPEVSELQVVRHYTALSQENFCIETQFYPLGSCTMKYNPRATHRLAQLPGFANRHPLTPAAQSQGYLACVYELQQYLCEITGMSGCALTPMAGAQGEFAGVAMIKAYHDAQGDTARSEIIVPDAAHGTNPASAVMCGFTAKTLPTKADGDVDIDALKAMVGPQTAGIMLTNPSTLGVFERNILDIADIVHDAGGLLYYDGANLNAILGQARPGDMGFDVAHLNLHKTFATPHGGGGPGCGPVVCNDLLKPYLPIPHVGKNADNDYVWLDETDCPATIGRLSGFMGNAGIILRALIYVHLLGAEGLREVGATATLNANYLLARLMDIGYEAAFPERRATHEFIITLQKALKTQGVKAMDVAKRLLDYNFHAPTTYFPLLIPECLLIEPTETESKETLDQFIAAMASIYEEIASQPEVVTAAPSALRVGRLDEVKAARDLDVCYRTAGDAAANVEANTNTSPATSDVKQ